MNKNLLLILITFSLASSCSKGGNIIKKINETFIVGKWRLTSVTENGSNVNLNDCERLKTFEFNTDKEVVIKIYDFNLNAECEISSDDTYDYSIDDNSITIQGIGDAEISTLKDETLILQSVEASNIIIKTFEKQ
ncbi:lipocalin-like domain-containing protein [Flavivirga algicola]|uniref:Lipocalin family protein n=1 Tax=Flavivirga algicola TaxID=2729136 RepID=A0ABX1RZI2_9FLAO|nr:lipocalin family protein [Flavivirga algicola]NMH88506.1 lipocalin family protein [Flavivirga algicola]